jgi:hypothetical protein
MPFIVIQIEFFELRKTRKEFSPVFKDQRFVFIFTKSLVVGEPKAYLGDVRF